MKKFLLIILGIILSLIILECGLRLAGFAISSYQQYKNNKALKNKSQYTIMCLGESTTQRQYPVQLQQILDEKYPNKFSIIDCGLGGSNLETILEVLDNNIKTYKPNISICMMGINNGLVLSDNSNTTFVKQKKRINLKIIELLYLIKYHIYSILKIDKVFADIQKDTDIQNLLDKAIYYHNIHKHIEARKILRNVLKIDSNNQIAYSFLIMDIFCCNAKYSSKYEQDLGYKMILYAIDNDYYDFYAYFLVGFDYLIENNKPIDELKERLMKKENFVITEKLYEIIENFLTDEEKDLLKQRKNIVTEENKDLVKVAEYLHNGLYDKANQYFDNRNKLLIKHPNLETYNLYKSIIRKLIDNNIKVICMQYPIISVEPLQEQLKNESYHDKIIFISNKQNFKEALTKLKYYELFRDVFARDFGHCTDLGNTMIAENVVATLEDMLDLKNK